MEEVGVVFEKPGTSQHVWHFVSRMHTAAFFTSVLRHKTGVFYLYRNEHFYSTATD